jgi:CRISPR/Cas system-associated exonuclease Cas4 (RecB family)
MGGVVGGTWCTGSKDGGVRSVSREEEGIAMNYSYSQISQYLTCPRRYRHRYLDGWQEKDVRAAMLFGRAFEQALAALFRHEDPAVVLYEQWIAYKHLDLVYPARDTWDNMLQQGVQLLERFVQDGRVKIDRPKTHQQMQFTRPLSSTSGFVSFGDAIGEVDGTTCVVEWKTSSVRYPEEPIGLTALDPQLICYSWMTGIDEVAQVVFVRKRTVEVQYLRATITDKQRQEFKTLVGDTVRSIESGLFLPHSGIRFPQNPCTTCQFVGLCLDQRDLVETALIRNPGVDLGLFDELGY